MRRKDVSRRPDDRRLFGFFALVIRLNICQQTE
jgi:hypothetical protein